MASNLLKTLQKIDIDRQILINKIQSLGYDISSDAPIRVAESFINGPIEPAPYNGGLSANDWVRPVEWPNTYDILAAAEQEDIEGCRAGAIFLIRTDALDTLTLPARTKGYSQSSTNISLGASFVKTSDGKTYDLRTTATEHTWDRTQDIVVTDGEYPGNFGYVILYFDPTYAFSVSMTGQVQSWPIVEMIINKISTSVDLSSTTYCYHSGFTYMYGSGAITNNLISYHVLPTSNLDNCYKNINGSDTIFVGTGVIRYINTGTITRLGHGYSGGKQYGLNPGEYCSEIHLPNMVTMGLTYLYHAKRLRIFDAPSYKSGSNAFFMNTDISKALKTFYAPLVSRYGSIQYGGSMELLNYGGTAEVLDGFTDLTPIDPAILSNKTIPSAIGSNIQSLRSMDFIISSPTQFGCSVELDETSYITPGAGCKALRSLYFPAGFKSRTDLSTLELNPTSVTQIINSLLDLTGLTVYNPNLKLSEYNKQLLSEADRKIATDKGWVIE